MPLTKFGPKTFIDTNRITHAWLDNPSGGGQCWGVTLKKDGDFWICPYQDSQAFNAFTKWANDQSQKLE